MPPVPVEPVPLSLQLFAICMYLVLPLSAVPAAIFLGFSRPDNRNAFVAAVMFLSFSAVAGLDPQNIAALGRAAALVFRPLGQNLACPSLVFFFLVFPFSSPLDRAWPWLKWIIGGWGLAQGLLTLSAGILRYTSLASHEKFMATPAIDRVVSLVNAIDVPLALALVTLAMVSLSMNRRAAVTPDERRRLNLMLTACLVSWLPLGVAILLQVAGKQLPPLVIAILSITTPVFPLTFGYVVVRHRVFGIRVILRRGLQYALVSRGVWAVALILFGGTYALATPLINSMIPTARGIAAPLTSAAVAIAIAAGLRAGIQHVMPNIDRRYFRDAYDARQILSRLAVAIREMTGQSEKLINLVGEQIQVALHPRSVTIFLRQSAIQGARRTYGSKASAPSTQACDVPGGFCCYLRREPGGVVSPKLSSPPDLMCGSDPEIQRLETLLAGSPEPLDLVPSALETPSPLRRVNLAEQLADIDSAVRELTDNFGGRLIVPLATGQRLVGLLVLGEKLSEEPYSKDDRELLQAVAGQLAIALDYSELIGEAAEQERMRQELSIAQDVQAQLFPQGTPTIATLQLTGACRPAREVGGDYYDFLELPDNAFGVALGDISGKGVSAALLMASLQGGLRSQAVNHSRDVSLMMGRINRLMCRTAPASKFATLFYAHWDIATRMLTYANAGHNPGLLLRRGATQPERLHATGLVLGVSEGADYEQVTLQLQPDDLLVLYTDGITEAEDASGHFFGEPRLADLVANFGDADIDDLRALIFAEVERFATGTQQHDDMTLVVARVL
ncbi:MAG: SpoIIE family protein phosphatase [Acidobacteriota bacterium]